MYNQDQKRSFIAEYTQSISTARVIESTFNQISKYEEALGKDICKASEEDAERIFREAFGSRERSANARLLSIKKYIQWCHENNIDGTNIDIIKIDTNSISDIRNTMFANPTHLQMYLDKTFDPICMDNADITFRCFIWMVYIGVPVDKVVSVKKVDVDFDSLVINVDGSQYKIISEAMPVFKKCVELDYLKSTEMYGDAHLDRFNKDDLLSGIKTTPELNSMRCMMKRRANKSGTKIPRFVDIRLSGFFYRKRELESIGVVPDFRDIAELEIVGKEYFSARTKNVSKLKIRVKSKELKMDYERWKDAFRV